MVRKPPLRLLFIEDPAGHVARLLEPIEQANPDLRIESVTNPQALETALEAGEFDVVLTPESAGWTEANAVLAAVRLRFPDRPVILLASPDSEELALEALGEGIEDYVLATPEDLPRLPARARSAVARAGQRLWAFAPMAFYRSTPDGAFLDASHAFVEKLGHRDRASLFATRAQDTYVDPEDRGRWRALMERQGTVRGFATRLRRADGSVLWVRETARVVRDPGGRLVRYEGFIEDITEHKQAEEALRESEDRFRSLVENTSDIVVEMGPDRRIRYASPSVERILGYRPAELVGTDALDLVHPEEVTRVAKVLAAVSLHPETTGIVEHRLRGKDGSWRPFESRGGGIADPTGPAGLVVIARDNTERVRADAALRESEDRYRRLVELSPDGIVVHSHGRLVFLNSAATQILGARDAAELLGRPVIDFVHPDSRGIAAERIPRILEEGREAPLIEERFVRLDGTVVNVEVAAIPFVYGGEPAVQVVIRDVTGRKQAEEERSTLTQAVEQAGESIVITDTQGAIVYVNPAFERITGYSRAEVLGRNPSIVKSGRHDASFYQEMWATLTRGEVWSGRLINKTKDGSLYEEEATISPVRDAARQVVNYVAVKRDVTREVHLEQQFLQAQKMEAVGRLAGGVAHDFNNLLGVISGYSELVLRRLPTDHPLCGKVEQIVKASSRAASLTRQLLAFSRRQVLQPKVLDLNLAMSDLDKMLRRLIGEDLELAMVLAEDLGCVKADPGQIEQVVMNLAVNARDAMPGGGKLTIETRNVDLDESYVREHPVMAAGRYVMLAVSDTGCGMDAGTQAHMFEPFFTTKEEGKGTGLGLSTVYGIVKQSGGYVWVYSEPGHGTTFKIYLPRVDDTTDASGWDAEPRPARATETILLVEDEEALRDMLRESLESNGHTVLVAGEGDEALRIAREHPGPIHLMITDVVMPGLSGREVAERATGLRPEMRVLYVSGYTDEALGRHGILDPGMMFLGKPFSTDALFHRVRQVLDAR